MRGWLQVNGPVRHIGLEQRRHAQAIQHLQTLIDVVLDFGDDRGVDRRDGRDELGRELNPFERLLVGGIETQNVAPGFDGALDSRRSGSARTLAREAY